MAVEPTDRTKTTDLTDIDPLRVRALREGPPQTDARYVLYWMQSNRRAHDNSALEHAIVLANQLQLPLVAYEGLRPDYPGASARIHTFVLEGARERHQRLRERGVRSAFYLQQRPNDHRDTLARLSQDAAILVTDHFPTAFFRRQTARLLADTALPVHTVDASTLVPLARFPKVEYAARTLRPKLHRVLPEYLFAQPERRLHLLANKLALPIAWETDLSLPVADLVASCQIDHGIAPARTFRGGTDEARAHLSRFVHSQLQHYDPARNDPGIRGTSELSPYLHFGMMGPLEVALAVLAANADEAQKVAFLEELIVRRELAFNFCEYHPDHATVRGLPPWAQRTLTEHDGDPRSGIWSQEDLERARTPDPVWNLAQRELLLNGKIHGYIRMLWGKKILEHSPSYEEAHRRMVALHERYALDGRDPNTYTNILWCMGLHDRPWGPPRPVLGLIRPMSSEATRRKTHLEDYSRYVLWLEHTRRS